MYRGKRGPFPLISNVSFREINVDTVPTGTGEDEKNRGKIERGGDIFLGLEIHFWFYSSSRRNPDFFFFNQPEITDLPMQEEVTHRGAERAAFRSNDKQRTRVNALITGFANFI